MQEQKIERKLRKEIELIGGKAYKFVSPGTAGVPDRIVLLPRGRIVFVEMKAPGEELSPLQKYRIKEIENLGFKTKVIDSREGVKDLINEVLL